MKLFIANCTQLKRRFTYRLAERRDPNSMQIDSGAQIFIDGSQDEIKQIIEQHERYGLVDVKKINATKAFSGLCYSIDKEINLNGLKNGADNRNEFIDDRAEKNQEMEVLAMDKRMKDEARKHGKDLPGLEVEVESEMLDPSQEDKKPVKKKMKVGD